MVYLIRIIGLFLVCMEHVHETISNQKNSENQLWHLQGDSGVSSDVLVTLPNGIVNGTLLQSILNSSYYGFMGIPYAQPPIGNLRFEAPQPAEAWDGVLDATIQKLSCVTSKYLSNIINESEDCLYLNVFTPNLQPLITLPVIVWIYGGGFQLGSAITDIYGPDFLIAENVIFASFNYRLGPLGFLSTGDDLIPGNNGLKDQNLALQWIKSNIGYFGGDPNQITIFGQGAGAASVGLHLLSDKSAGLFRAAIMNSGCSLNIWTVQENPAALFNEYVSLIPGNLLGSSLGIKEALQGLAVAALILAYTLFPQTNSVYDFVPVIEAASEEAFLTAYHYQLLETGAYNNVPVLMGINMEEGSNLIGTTSDLLYFANMYDLTPETLIPANLNVSDSNTESAISAIQQMYLTADGTFLSNLTAVVKYFGDNIIVRSCLKQAELLSSHLSPVYLYEFDYFGNRHLLSGVSVTGTGDVSNADELPYLFYSPLAYNTIASDVLMQNRMVTMWTNFVKYLIPIPLLSPLFNYTIWLPYDNVFGFYLQLDTTIEIQTNLRMDIMNEWDNIFETYGETPFDTY